MNASALRGQLAYTEKMEALARVRLLGVLEVLLVWLPLGFHVVYGLAVVMREPIKTATLPRTWALASRGASVVALAFIAWHVVEYRTPHGALGPQGLYGMLVWRLSSVWHGFPVRATLYLLGILATSFHFAAGAWSFGVSSALLVTDAQKKRGAVWLGAVGSIVFLLAAATVVSLATGVQLEATIDAPPCEPQK